MFSLGQFWLVRAGKVQKCSENSTSYVQRVENASCFHEKEHGIILPLWPEIHTNNYTTSRYGISQSANHIAWSGRCLPNNLAILFARRMPHGSICKIKLLKCFCHRLSWYRFIHKKLFEQKLWPWVNPDGLALTAMDVVLLLNQQENSISSHPPHLQIH